MKRFYDKAEVATVEGGHTVELDGRPVRTPARHLLVLPNAALAGAVAAEWAAQDGTVEPDTMPLTRLATTAIDRITPNRDAVIDEIAGFGATDLLCHRAADPADLAARQAEGWQPLLDWLADHHGARLTVTEGIIAVAQTEAAPAALRRAVAGFDDPALAALHSITSICGSVVIALALAGGRIDADEAWCLSRIDEAFQEQRWGVDPDPEGRGERSRAEVTAAAGFLALCGA